MRIIVDDKIPFIRGQVERLCDEVVYLAGSRITADDVREADVLIVRTRTLCNRSLLEGSRVRLIVTATIGYDHIDTQYLREAGILWTNSPGCNATSVAQYVRNALLEAEQAGLIRLGEASVGIVGYGHVGRAVCEALRPYVRNILLNDPFLRLHDDVGECDVITLHTPLTSDGPYPTRHMVDEEFLHRLTRRPILINAARGGVVDEAALKCALREGRICQAIIDTWEGEPDIDRSLLREVFVGTPHIAGYSADGKANATRMALEAVARWSGQSGLRFDIEVPPASPERTGLAYRPSEDGRMLKANPSDFERQRGLYPPRRE